MCRFVQYIMRLKIIFFAAIFTICFTSLLAQPIAHRMKLLSNWNNPNLNKVDSINIWNDLTCWYDSINKREFVIAGSTDSIYFFDISNPNQIKLCDVKYGAVKFVINRDYEIYQHYVYCVSDQNRGALQIFDLQYLPDSVHKIYDDSTLAINTHSIFIESKSKRLYMCSNKYPNWKNGNGNESAMDIISLDTPEKPKFLAKLEVPKQANGDAVFRWVHELTARNDTAYISCGYSGMYIYDLRDLTKQKIISSIINYTAAGYNHSSSLDASGKHIMFTDEVPAGLPIKIFDINIIQAPRIESMFSSHTGAIPHNAYWMGNFAYVSYYHDGVYIYNLNDTKKPYVEAYYDTYPDNPSGVYKGYSGCWGIYPFLPSGNIVASDRTYGIFVLRADSGLMNTSENEKSILRLNIFPNPTTDELNIAFETSVKDNFNLVIYDLQGKISMQFDKKFDSNYLYKLDLSDLPNGIYTLQATGQKHLHRAKFIKN